MRLWLINQYAIPPSQAGGTRHHGIARALMRRGHQVVLIAGDLDYASQQSSRLAPGESWRLETLDGVPYLWLRVPGYAGNSIGRVWSMLTFARRVMAWADGWPLVAPELVIGSTPHLFAAWAAERLAARYKVPFVLEVRDLWPDSLVEVAGVSPRHPLVLAFERLERHLYRRAQAIVTLLPGAATRLVEKGARAETITWIPNGVDLALAPAPSPPPEGGPFVVTYAGAHGVANGLDSILDAAALLQQEGWEGKLKFRFIGTGPERARLQARVHDEDLRLVTLEDPVPKELVFQELARSHAFIATLRDVELYRYGISLNKLYDYLAMARPTVFGAKAFNNPIDEARAGLTVAPEDPRALADAVATLARMPAAERWEMSLRGRAFVEKYHDAGLLGGRLDDVLKAVVRRQGPAGDSRPAAGVDTST